MWTVPYVTDTQSRSYVLSTQLLISNFKKYNTVILYIYSFLAELSPFIYLQPSDYNQNTVGERQQVICSVIVPLNVDPDVVELAWLNEEDIITADSRVTIVNSTDIVTNFSIRVVSTVIQFNRLLLNDEGVYTCNLLLNGSIEFTSIQLQNFRSTYVIYNSSILV